MTLFQHYVKCRGKKIPSFIFLIFISSGLLILQYKMTQNSTIQRMSIPTQTNIQTKNNSNCEELPLELYAFKTKPLLTLNTDKLLLLLSVFALFAEEYNIPWRLDGGSQLGAIRHHGQIPWDDDLDLAVPHSYYNITKTQLTIFVEDNFKDTFGVFDKHWMMHGVIKLYYVSNLKKGYAWPFLDIWYPCPYYYKTDPIEWSTARHSNWLKGGMQTYVDLETFYQFRYVFLYHENIDFANKLIFKVHYKIRHHEQWRLNETVAGEWDHIHEKPAYLNQSLKTIETVENMRKYFNFVEYKYLNNTHEIESLKQCNSNVILQRIEYKREYFKTDNDTILCIETATRFRDSTKYTLKSKFLVQNVSECLFDAGLI
eukprot:22576_1